MGKRLLCKSVLKVRSGLSDLSLYTRDSGVYVSLVTISPRPVLVEENY